MRVYNPGLMDKLFGEDERAYATQEVRAGRRRGPGPRPAVSPIPTIYHHTRDSTATHSESFRHCQTLPPPGEVTAGDAVFGGGDSARDVCTISALPPLAEP